MQETNYIITGSSGYIGSNFLLKNPKTLTVDPSAGSTVMPKAKKRVRPTKGINPARIR